MACCSIAQVGGIPSGSAVAAADSAAWVERSLGDLSGAPVVDLAAGVNPTVTVTNDTETAGQVANTQWTSNAGDATASVTQGAVTSYGTNGTTGLVLAGASASTLFTETSHQAPHIWCAWSDLLGEDPVAGAEYLFLVRIDAENISANQQAVGVGLYVPNDGVSVPDTQGNPAIDDEKRLAGWLEQEAGQLGLMIREEATPDQQIYGARLPVGYDVVGLMMRGGSYAFGVVGVSVGGAFPDPSDLICVPGPFLGGSTSFPSHPYLDPQERVAIACQQQLGSTLNFTIGAYQVSSRLG